MPPQTAITPVPVTVWDSTTPIPPSTPVAESGEDNELTPRAIKQSQPGVPEDDEENDDDEEEGNGFNGSDYVA